MKSTAALKLVDPLHGRDVLQEDLSVYKTLLESTKAIPWKIDWASKTFAYIGPQIESLLGFSQSSWETANDWAMRMHPDDRDKVVGYCLSQSEAGIDHEADYRALTADGGYVWIRDVVHVVRNARGETDSLIGFMFDISERKKAEDKVKALQTELERLVMTDGLTGISNRRRFDVQLDVEWLNAARNGTPLSLVLLDIDFFKPYNDRHGHLAGDDCLKAVATALSSTAQRPLDLVARFGGEEFALLLPETDANAARLVAERCIHAIRDLRIGHDHSPIGPFVTASAGVGTTMVNDRAMPTAAFLERIDQMLYQAKHGGRNRVEAANLQPA